MRKNYATNQEQQIKRGWIKKKTNRPGNSVAETTEEARNQSDDHVKVLEAKSVAKRNTEKNTQILGRNDI